MGTSTNSHESLKILILGISGSGKSTFTKQLKILYENGFSNDERYNYVEILKANVIMGIRELADYIVSFEDDIEISEKHRKYVRFIRERSSLHLDLLDENVYSKIIALWNDPGLSIAWERTKNYQIQVSQLDYLMENIERFIDPEFVPTDEDIIRARQRTAGAAVTRFPYSNYVMEVIDVGGQAPERAKWMSIAQQDLTTVIYFGSLDEYNMISAEDQNKTKMQISMDVFAKIVVDLRDKVPTFVLFLNKTDLFRKKIITKEGYQELQDHFPKYSEYYKKHKSDEIYEGMDRDERRVVMASNFLEEQFRRLLPKEINLEVKKTCTLNSEITKQVFEELMEEFTGVSPTVVSDSNTNNGIYDESGTTFNSKTPGDQDSS